MYYWLATEAEASGFGFQFNLFESNVINLAVVVGVLVYFVGGLLKTILAERRAAIEAEISEAEKRQRDAKANLDMAQQKLSQAKGEAERILATAQEGAKAAKAEIMAATEREIERIRQGASQDTSNFQDRAIAELRRRTAELALQQVETELNNRLRNNNDAQQQLIDRSIALLGGHR
jgi:F-type H+-transporting ATPase subunit b